MMLKQNMSKPEWEKLLKEDKGKYKKVFLGKINEFKDKQERAKEKAHLEAYVNGEERYVYGKNNFGNKMYHPVLMEYVLKSGYRKSIK